MAYDVEALILIKKNNNNNNILTRFYLKHQISRDIRIIKYYVYKIVKYAFKTYKCLIIFTKNLLSEFYKLKSIYYKLDKQTFRCIQTSKFWNIYSTSSNGICFIYLETRLNSI